MDRRSEVVLVQDGTRVIWTVPHRRVAGLALGRGAARGSLSLALHGLLCMPSFRAFIWICFFSFVCWMRRLYVCLFQSCLKNVRGKRISPWSINGGFDLSLSTSFMCSFPFFFFFFEHDCMHGRVYNITQLQDKIIQLYAWRWLVVYLLFVACTYIIPWFLTKYLMGLHIYNKHKMFSTSMLQIHYLSNAEKDSNIGWLH